MKDRAKYLLWAALAAMVISALSNQSVPRREGWTAADPTPQEDILLGSPTIAESNEIDALFREWTKDDTASTYGWTLGADVDQRIRWQVFTKILKARERPQYSLFKAPNGVHFWVAKNAEGSIADHLNECVDTQRFVSRAADILATSWGPDDPRSDRVLQLKPQKMKSGALVSPIIYEDYGMHTPAGDVVMFSKKFGSTAGHKDIGKVNRESGSAIKPFSWKLVLVHEVSHFLAQVVPGTGSHSIIFFMVMQDVLKRLASAKLIAVRMLKAIEQPEDIEKLDDPLMYGYLLPGDPADWPAIRKKVSEWKMQLDDNKNPQARTFLRIAYEELGGGEGPEYEKLRRMFPKFCAYLDQTGFWRKPVEKRPFM